MGKFEGKIATNWPSEREKIKKGLKIVIEWLCPDAFICNPKFLSLFSVKFTSKINVKLK